MNGDSENKKRILGGVFDRGASSYDDIPYFPPLGKWLAEMAAIPAGGRVLDVACGRGAVLLPAAQAVGPAGEAIGIDLAPSMIAETNRTLRQLRLNRARAIQMDAENLEFEDQSFDRVMCGFALFFFPDLERALAEYFRVLRPGGVFATTTWGTEDGRWDHYYEGLLPKYGADVSLTSHNLSPVDTLAALLKRAGFVEIKTFEKRLDAVFPDKEAWWSARWSVSGRAGLERLSPEQVEELKQETFAWMETLREPDGFHDLIEARCTLALRPSRNVYDCR